MTASWWQTVVLAAIGAATPPLMEISMGHKINGEATIASIALATLVAIANILRSPHPDPPTMIKKKEDGNV